MFKICSMPGSGLFLTCRSQGASPYLVVAAIIAIVAGSVLTGSLFRTLGYSALSLGATGICTAVFLLAIAYKLKNRSTTNILAQTSTPAPTSSSTIAPFETQAKENKNLINIENGDVDDTNELPTEELYIASTAGLTRAMCDVNIREWLNVHHLAPYVVDLSIRYPGLCLLGNMPVISNAPFQATKFSNEDDFQDQLFKQLPTADSSYHAIPFFWHVNLNHWTLVYIDLQEKTVEYYDSKRKYGNYEKIISILTNVATTLKYTFKNKTATDDNDPQKDVLQPDPELCGFWALYFLINRLNPATQAINFSTLDPKEAQPMIEEFRVEVLKTLFNFCVKRDRAEAEEMAAYRRLYKKNTALENYIKDAEFITLTKRWKQILAGKRLKPIEAPN